MSTDVSLARGADQVAAEISGAVGRDTAAVRDRLAVLRGRLALERIPSVVVVSAEKPAFDNLYGTFPSANGLQQALASRADL